MRFPLPTFIRTHFRRPKVLIPVSAAVLGAAIWLGSPASTGAGTGRKLHHTVERGPFTIALDTGGELQAIDEVTVRSEVPGSNRILSLVEEGSIVEAGDLLIELDSAEIEDDLSEAEIDYQDSVGEATDREEQLETVRSENAIGLSDVQLELEFAKQDLLKYREGEWPQALKKAESAITLATEELRRAEDRLEGTERLEKKGYATSAELAADQLVVQRRQVELESAREDLRLLTEFDQPQQLRKLEANVDNAEIRLERTRRQNESQLEKARSRLVSARETLKLREQKLAELREALENTEIRAPQAGLVVYEKPSHWRREPVEEGSSVRERQELISLPDVSRLKVPVNIYENQISLVEPGMRAYVHIDALPGQRFHGVVGSIATMPEPSRDNNPNNRVYKAEVRLKETIPDIKPGITARVEVLIAELEDAVKVPLQAVVGIEDRQFCFVSRGGKPVPVEVEVGLFDNEFVEIRDGLEVGDEVSLVPPEVTRLPDALARTDADPEAQRETRVENADHDAIAGT